MQQQVVKVSIENMSGSVKATAELHPSGLIRFGDGEWSHISHEKAAGKTVKEVVEEAKVLTIAPPVSTVRTEAPKKKRSRG